MTSIGVSPIKSNSLSWANTWPAFLSAGLAAGAGAGPNNSNCPLASSTNCGAEDGATGGVAGVGPPPWSLFPADLKLHPPGPRDWPATPLISPRAPRRTCQPVRVPPGAKRPARRFLHSRRREHFSVAPSADPVASAHDSGWKKGS